MRGGKNEVICGYPCGLRIVNVCFVLPKTISGQGAATYRRRLERQESSLFTITRGRHFLLGRSSAAVSHCLDMTECGTGVRVAGCFLRLATPADVPHVVSLIRGLAEYEKLLDECFATEDKMHQALFATTRQPYEVRDLPEFLS